MVAARRKPPKRKPKSKVLAAPEPAEKRRRGRPEFEPTPEQRRMVEGMVGFGIPEDDICKVVGDKGISAVTLRKHFRRELDVGITKANAAVVASLFKKATSQSQQAVTAQIWWTKTRMGWKETSVVEHQGKVVTVTRNMTDAEAAEAYAATRRSKKAA